MDTAIGLIRTVGKRSVSQLSDESLARRVAAGEVDGFAEILRRHRSRVFRVCYRMAGNAEDAEDWTQECFTRTYQQLPKYNASRPFSPWLWRVVANACINLANSRNRRQSHVDLGIDLMDNLPSTAPNPSKAAVDRDEALRLRSAVEDLSPPIREAIVLRIVEGMSLKELADAQGVPLQTAAARVRRGLMQARAKLEASGMELDR